MKQSIDALKYPLGTEKSLRLVDSENKLTFIVALHTTKKEIRKAVEEEFKARVVKVNTVILPDGRKKAYVKFAPEYPARDIATQLGMI